MIESFELGLAVCRSERGLTLLGDAVAAASASLVGAICEKLLAFVQLNFLVGPKHLATHTIGNIDGEIAIESNHASVRDVEIAVMRGDNGIVVSGRGEFLRVLCAPGNYRVRVQTALRGKTIGQRYSDGARARRIEERISRGKRPGSELVTVRGDSRRGQREQDQKARERSDSPEVEVV